MLEYVFESDGIQSLLFFSGYHKGTNLEVLHASQLAGVYVLHKCTRDLRIVFQELKCLVLGFLKSHYECTFEEF